eukprot:1159707-Pelagomonas_calceolata.AAC.4
MAVSFNPKMTLHHSLAQVFTNPVGTLLKPLNRTAHKTHGLNEDGLHYQQKHYQQSRISWHPCSIPTRTH